MDRKRLLLGLVTGTVLQVLMVVGGHSNPDVQEWFAIGGMGISALAGGLAAWGSRAWGGAMTASGIAGGLSALIGIGVSVVLGDVPESLLLFGTLASLVTGVIGGVLARAITRG